PPEMLTNLSTVPGLQRGRSQAREPDGIRPVAWRHVEATLPFLPRPVAAMVQVQWLCGCRAGEVMSMRGRDLTAGEANWVCEPASHKNAWRGKSRQILLGPRAQAIIQEFQRPDPEEFLFRPCDATAERDRRRAARRKTKRTPSELRRQSKQAPRVKPGL